MHGPQTRCLPDFCIPSRMTHAWATREAGLQVEREVLACVLGAEPEVRILRGEGSSGKEVMGARGVWSLVLWETVENSDLGVIHPPAPGVRELEIIYYLLGIAGSGLPGLGG